MVGVLDCINSGVRRFVVCGLCTGFDLDSDLITIRLNEVIDIGFQIYILRDVVMTRLRVL